MFAGVAGKKKKGDDAPFETRIAEAYKTDGGFVAPVVRDRSLVRRNPADPRAGGYGAGMTLIVPDFEWAWRSKVNKKNG